MAAARSRQLGRQMLSRKTVVPSLYLTVMRHRGVATLMCELSGLENFNEGWKPTV